MRDPTEYVSPSPDLRKETDPGPGVAQPLTEMSTGKKVSGE
jgi:hypothetical protein